MLRPHPARRASAAHPFRVVPSGCPSCGHYLHPMPLDGGPSQCPDCRSRGARR